MWSTLDILVMLTHFADTMQTTGATDETVCRRVKGADQSPTEKTKQMGRMKHDSDVGNAHSIADTVEPRSIIQLLCAVVCVHMYVQAWGPEAETTSCSMILHAVV